MKKLLLSLFLSLLSCFGLQGQVSGSHLSMMTSVPTVGTVCGGYMTFGITITNTSAFPVTQLSVNPFMPLGMEFVGIQQPQAAFWLVNGPSLNAPNLEYLDTLQSQGSLVLIFTARATCTLASTIADSSGVDTLLNNVRADYVVQGQNFFTFPLANYSYNVVTPRLNISLVTPSTQTLQVGNTVVHRVVITNTGLGIVDSFRLHIDVEGELDFVSRTDNNASVTNSQSGTSANVVLICTDNNGFQPNESVEFLLTFYVARCGPATNTDYTVHWGCWGDVCNVGASNSATSSNVSVPMLNGNVVRARTQILDQGNYCSDSLATVRIWFKNNGLGAAHNINMDLGSSYYLGTPVSVTMALGPFPPLLITGPLVGNIWNNGYMMRYFILAIDSLGMDLDGPGGLSNLDGAMFYNDLAAGDSFYVDYTFDLRFGTSCMHFANLCDFTSYESYVDYSVRFETACGQSGGVGNMGADWPFYSIFFGKQANGPTDLVPGDTAMVHFSHTRQDQFNYAWGGLWNCPVDSFVAVFTLPPGLDLVGDSAGFGYSSDVNLAIRKRVTRIGNQVFVPGVHYVANAPVSTNFFLPIVATCPQSGQRTLQIDWEINYICDTSCNCPLKLACGALDVVVHCPGSSCDGFVNHGMWVQRNSFGWTDYTRTTYADANTPGVKLDRVYPCDSILFRAIATVGGGLPYDSARLRLSYPVQYNDPLIAFQSGRFTVNGVPCGGVVTANMVSLVATGINPTSYNLEIPLHLSCLQLQLGDSVEFEGSFKTGDLNVVNLPKDYQIDQFRAEMYAIDSVGDTLGCDDWGARLYTLTPQTVPTSPPYAGDIYCGGGQPVHYNYFVPGFHGQAHGDFTLVSPQLEYRPDAEIGDTIRVILPNTFDVVPSSAYLHTHFFIPVGTDQYPVTTLMNPGLTTNEWLFIHPNWNAQGGGFVHYGWNSYVQFFTLNIRPKNCDALNGINEHITFIQDFIFHAFAQDSLCRAASRSTVNLALRYYPPYPTLDPGNAIQDGYQRTTDWQVKVCNFPPPANYNGPADSIWISFTSGSPDLTVTEVFDNTHNQLLPIDSISPGLVWVRYPYPILPSACAEFTITAAYANCTLNALDTIAVRSGPICGPMPAHPDSASCVLNTQLVIRYKNADLQMLVTNGPTTPFDFCRDFPVELLLKSSGLGSMYSVAADVTLPVGLDFVPGSFEYAFPSVAPFQPLAAPTLLAGRYHWDISNLLFTSMGQDTGFTGIIDTLHNQIKVRFRVRPNCDFAPGGQVAVSARGLTNCQSQINIAPFLTPPLVPIGFPVPGAFDVQIDASGITCNDSTAMVNVLVRNTSNRATAVGDDIFIILDTGMTYLNGFMGMHNPPNPFSLVAVGPSLQWPMPTGVAAGDSIWFRFQVGLGTDFCRTWGLNARTTFSAAVTCPDTNCTLVAQTGSAESHDSLCCCDHLTMPYYPDARADSLHYDCLADKIQATARICNFGNMPLGANTYYAYYAHHPGSTTAPILLGTSLLGQSVPPGQCMTTSFTFPAGYDSVYVVINDIGQGPFPYDFAGQLPYNTSGECYFRNNVIGRDLDCICDSLNVHAGFDVSVNGALITLQDTSTGPVSTLQWFVGDSMVPGLPGGTITITADTTGAFPICLVAIANGSCPHNQSPSAYCCSDTLCTTFTIDSCAFFHANFSYVIQNAIQGIVAFTDLSTPYPNTITTWAFGDGDTAQSVPGQTILHQYGQHGTFTVVVNAMVLLHDNLCCRATYKAEVVVRKIELHPNPADHYITVRYELPDSAVANVALISAKGEAITEVEDDADGIETFDIRGIAKGLYLIRITTLFGVWSEQFVKN